MALEQPDPKLRTRWRDTLELWIYGLLRARLILLLTPRVVERTERRVSVRIPLSYRSRNHFGSMQFGALMIGAEMGPGILAIKRAEERGVRVAFLMRRFEARLLHRANGGVTFRCQEDEAIDEAITRSQSSGTWQLARIAVDAWSDAPDARAIAHFEGDLALRVI